MEVWHNKSYLMPTCAGVGNQRDFFFNSTFVFDLLENAVILYVLIKESQSWKNTHTPCQDLWNYCKLFNTLSSQAKQIGVDVHNKPCSEVSFRNSFGV